MHLAIQIYPNASMQRLPSASRTRVLLLVCKILLYHSTNLSIRIEVLANGPLFVQRTTYLLCSATNWAISYMQYISVLEDPSVALWR